jgi:hypothetical protein
MASGGAAIGGVQRPTQFYREIIFFEIFDLRSLTDPGF